MEISKETIVGVARPRYLHKGESMEIRGPWWRRYFEDMGWVKRKKGQYGVWCVPAEDKQPNHPVCK